MRRWRTQHEIAREAAADLRAGAVMGMPALVDYLWDNLSARAFHPACVPEVDFGPRVHLLELGAFPGDMTCAHCQRAIE